MNTKTEVPDGGWGWAVVAGTAIINVFNQSLLSMFGLIFGEKLEAMAGTTGVTTVMSVNCTVSNFSGFLISPLSKYFSTKQITQIGVLLVSAGLGLSIYTESYVRVILGYGVLSGLGLGLIASSTFLIINSYFIKNKSQAVGLAMAGTSVGQMVMPLISALLMEHYGDDGTILVLSGLSLHGIVGAMFFDPVSEHMLSKNASKTKNHFFSRLRDRISCLRNGNPVVIVNNPSLTENQTSLESRSDSSVGEDVSLISTDVKYRDTVISENYSIEIDDRTNDKNADAEFYSSISENEDNIKTEDERRMFDSQTENEEDEIENKSQTCCGKFVAFFGLRILLDPIFVHIMIGLSLAYTSSISFSTFFPLFLREDLDMTVIDASTCMAVLSLVDFLGRIIVPLITKQIDITHRTTFILGSFLLAASRSVLARQTEYSMVIIFSALVGLARAATVINQNLVIAEYSKEAHVSSAVGLNMVSKGFFVLTIGELLGAYKDSAHNFSSCIHILDIISAGVALSWSLEVIIKKLQKRHSA